MTVPEPPLARETRTLYELMGVSPWHVRNKPEELAAARRRLAAQFHPDRGGSHDDMARVNDAYAILSNTRERGRYEKLQLARTHRACTTCGGEGQVWRQRGFAGKTMHTCLTCKGWGYVRK